MLVGTRNASGPVSEEQFARQWQDPVTGPELRELGVEVPEQLGALFMADAPALKRAAADTLPLLDDYPKRLTPAFSALPDDRFAIFRRWMDVQKTRSGFGESAVVRRLWPPALRERSLEWFDVQGTINRGLSVSPNVITEALFGTEPPLDDMNTLDHLLTRTELRTLPMWLLGSSEQHQRIIDRRLREGQSDAAIDYHLGIRAMADRNYDAAAEHFRRLRNSGRLMSRSHSGASMRSVSLAGPTPRRPWLTTFRHATGLSAFAPTGRLWRRDSTCRSPAASHPHREERHHCGRYSSLAASLKAVIRPDARAR